MRQAVQRFVKDAYVPLYRSGGIDVERRSNLSRDFGNGDVFGEKLAVPIIEMIHQACLDRR